jgi:hypothetical protein
MSHRIFGTVLAGWRCRPTSPTEWVGALRVLKRLRSARGGSRGTDSGARQAEATAVGVMPVCDDLLKCPTKRLGAAPEWTSSPSMLTFKGGRPEGYRWPARKARTWRVRPGAPVADPLGRIRSVCWPWAEFSRAPRFPRALPPVLSSVRPGAAGLLRPGERACRHPCCRRRKRDRAEVGPDLRSGRPGDSDHAKALGHGPRFDDRVGLGLRCDLRALHDQALSPELPADRELLDPPPRAALQGAVQFIGVRGCQGGFHRGPIPAELQGAPVGE